MQQTYDHCAAVWGSYIFIFLHALCVVSWLRLLPHVVAWLPLKQQKEATEAFFYLTGVSATHTNSETAK